MIITGHRGLVEYFCRHRYSYVLPWITGTYGLHSVGLHARNRSTESAWRKCAGNYEFTGPGFNQVGADSHCSSCAISWYAMNRWLSVKAALVNPVKSLKQND